MDPVTTDIPRWRVMLVREDTEHYDLSTTELSARAASEIARTRLRDMDREAVLVIYVKTSSFAGTEIVALGGVNGASVRPTEIFRGALVAGASHIIMAHCHPSGRPEPSVEDILITSATARAGDVLGIPLLDHIIVGCGTDTSFSFADSMPHVLTVGATE